MDSLPASRRAPFLKVLRLWCGGDVDRFVEKARVDEDFVVETVTRVIEALKREGLAPKTVNFYLYLLNRFFKFAKIRLDWGRLRIVTQIPKNRVSRVDRPPTVNELRKLILSAQSRRMRVLLHFLAVTGLRPAEAFRLKPENFDFDATPPSVRFVSAKTFQPREVFLTREIAEELRKYIAERKEEYMFGDYVKIPRNFNRDFDNLRKRVGLDHRDPSGRGWVIHPYSLRKFFKTRLEEAGVNPLCIELWMGHVSDVVHAYFKPSRKMLVEEWSKAEKALTLFSDEEPVGGDRNKVERLEKELDELRRLVAQLRSLVLERDAGKP
ncbi:MAG: site-specific integrase [Candidatus Caldarchaeum sp.]